MLSQYFHHAAIRAEFIVCQHNLSHRAALRSLKNRVQTIGIRLIGAEHAKIRRIHSEDIPKEISELARSLGQDLTGPRNLECIIRKIGHCECDKRSAAIHMRIAAHASIAHWSESCQLVNELPVLIEELLWFVASHPGLKDAEMLGVVTDRCERNLVRAEGALNRNSIHFLRAGPSFRRAEDDHRPDGLFPESCAACLLLNRLDLCIAIVQRLSQKLMHNLRIVTLDEVRIVSSPSVKGLQGCVAGAPLGCGRRDFVAVEMQNRKDRAVPHRVEKVD